MDYRHKMRPVQLFIPSSHNPNILRLNKSALNSVLGHNCFANRKIVVISVSGAYRKGKSLLLNFVLEYLYILQYSQKNGVEMEWLQDESQLEGFHFRSGSKRDTVGIWVWAEPIMIDASNGERYAVLLMDTQGCFEQNLFCSAYNSLNNHNNSYGNNNNDITNNMSTNFDFDYNFSNNANYSNNAALTLSTLLSCIQLYNFTESIPEEAFNALDILSEYGKLVNTEAPELGKPLQKLVMVVRDFKMTEEMAYGFEGGSKLLNNLFKQSSTCKTKNGFSLKYKKIHNSINYFNDGVSCCLLPHPGMKVGDGNNTFRGHIKDIKGLFRDEVRRLIESLIGPNVIKPKIINGREITVRKFIDCVREYAKIFESPELINGRDVLNANLHLNCVDYVLDAKLAYCRGINRIIRTSRMIPEKKLIEGHIKYGIRSLNIYDCCPKIESGNIRNYHLAQLQESINQELEKYKKINEEKRVTTCTSALLTFGDSVFFGLGLGSAASGATAVTIITLQMGMVSAGIVAIPVSLCALFGIWTYVALKPTIRSCLGIKQDS